MKRLEYKTPEIEVINIEVEGVIASSGWGINALGDVGTDASSVSSKSSAIKSSYSMDDYNWK